MIQAEIESDILPFCAKNNIGVIVFKAPKHDFGLRSRHYTVVDRFRTFAQ